jgi:2-methylcitrate dehydratase PrpD
MITALFDIVEQNRIDPVAVRKVDIALSPSVFDLHGRFARYRAKFEALLSAHYVASIVLHDRELTLAQFEPARYDHPKLRKFVERIAVSPDPALAGVQARVDVEMTDGTTLSARCDHPRGSPENRLSRSQIENEFRTYAAERLSRARIDDVVTAVFQLEQLASVRLLMGSLRQSAGTTERASVAAE